MTQRLRLYFIHKKEILAADFSSFCVFWHGSGQLYKFVGRFGKSSRGRFTKSPYKLLSTVCRLLNHARFLHLCGEIFTEEPILCLS